MGYIYKTTNLINNKHYIGKHNGKKPRYMGSGVILQQAFKKYGIENFTKQILFESESEEELREKEIEFINKENAVRSNDYYNVHLGGQGGHIAKPKGAMSKPIKKYWDNLTEEEYKKRCKNQGKHDKSGAKNPTSKIAIVNGKEYECLKDALKDFDIPYSTLKQAARTQKFCKKYNISAQYK